MRTEDRKYFERRAEEELDLAQQAKSLPAVKAHYELLGHYLTRLYPPEGGLEDRDRSR
jgi:hypothetical protein